MILDILDVNIKRIGRKLKACAVLGNRAVETKNKSAECIGVDVLKFDADSLLDLGDRRATRNSPGLIRENLNCFYLILVIVRLSKFANQTFNEVGGGNDTVKSAVLIKHDSERFLMLTHILK